MKKIRALALILSIITVLCVFASCATVKENNSSSSSSSTKQEETPKEPPKKFTVCDLVFDGKSDEFDERFEVEKEGNVTEDGVLEVKANGSYAINDKDFVLTNEDYEKINIEFVVNFSKLPTAGTPSIVSPLYYFESLKGAIDEDGNENETGVVYQFFIKVDSNGKIAYYNKNWIGGYYKDSDGNDFKVIPNKNYTMRIEYDNLDGTYKFFVDGAELDGAGIIVSPFEDGNMIKSVYRFFDNNEKVTFDAKIAHIFIEAIPYED